MKFDEVEGAIPYSTNEKKAGRRTAHMWPEGSGTPFSDWGDHPGPPAWKWNAPEEPLQFSELAHDTGARMRVTDHATKSQGDFLIFVEWPSPAGSADPTFWRGVTYQRFCLGLQDWMVGDDSVVAYMRGTWAPTAVRVVLGLDDTELLPGPPPPPDEGLVSPLTLLRTLLLFSIEERRNYPGYWLHGGGRYMPLRIALGVVFGTLDREDFQMLGRSFRGGSPVLFVLDRAKPLPLRFVAPDIPDVPPEGAPEGYWYSFS